MGTLDGKFWNQPWNPIYIKGGGWHCTKISPGCRHCWAEAMSIRFGNKIHFGFSETNPYVEFELDQRILEQPLHWKKPRIVSVQWLGDLFHEQIPISFVDSILEVVHAAKQHKFLVLTKRPQNFSGCDFDNLWFGVSICTQKEADEKIPILLQTPAVHRYVNIEPCLEEIDLMKLPIFEEHGEIFGIDWILMGAESGPGRRPMKLEWARSIAKQCKEAWVPLWVKQLELEDWANSIYKAKTKVSRDMNEWEPDLRIRQWPW